MALPDPSLIDEIPVIRETKPFTDPAAPGKQWDFTFEAQHGYPAALFLEDVQEKLTQRYVTQGVYVDGPKGAKIAVSETLCIQLALIMSMDRSGVSQSPPVPNWQAASWVIFAYQCPIAFMECLTWAYDLQSKAIDASEGGDSETGNVSLKNDSAADGDTLSEPPRDLDTSILTS